MIALEVESCGPGTSVQDAGRIGFRRFGVSAAGAMDQRALAVSNAVVGNPLTGAAIEFTLLGGSFVVTGGRLSLALSGPGCVLSIAGRPVPADVAAAAEAGDRVTVGPVRQGVYAYLAVGGGFALDPEMGSCSVHRRSGIGGRMLAAGDRLACAGRTGASSSAGAPVIPAESTGLIRVIPGPQDDYFAPQAMVSLLSEAFVVQLDSDRMGCRLRGPALDHIRGYNIVSDGVVPGSIQVPGDRQPIVLMRDCQTTGGYPKIATVISADLDRMAQAQPGTALRFAAVTRDEAVAAARQRALGLARMARAAGEQARLPTTEALLAVNLISGMVNACAPDGPSGDGG